MEDKVETRRAASLLGALVADAASLGLHWIYDVGRVAKLADARGSAAFVPIDPKNFEGVPAYFAHAARHDGQCTQYGETLLAAMRALHETGGTFRQDAVQAAFVETFGPGGTYAGYIDRPTRGTLDNIACGQTDPSGIDDDQLPATARLPALVAASKLVPDAATIEAMIRVTNVNADASAYGHAFVQVLASVLSGATISEALRAGADAAADPIRSALTAALTAEEADSVAYGEITQRACHLPMAMPLAFHILERAPTFTGAIERNIRAGGDSAGRAILIGAIMGARHGIAGETGVPLDWILKTHAASEAWPLAQDLAKK